MTDLSPQGVILAVALVYGAYFLFALPAMRAVWRRTADVAAPRRTILRTLAIAVLFAPTLAGMRIAPFLLAVVAWIVLDLLFVRPLGLAWAQQSIGLVAQFMVLPCLVTWALLLAGAFVVQWARKKQ